MAGFLPNKDGDIDPATVPGSIKETFLGAEVRNAKFPDDMLARAQRQGITRDTIRALSRRYIAMRMSDLESLAVDESFEGLPLEIQKWLEVNIMKRILIERRSRISNSEQYRGGLFSSHWQSKTASTSLERQLEERFGQHTQESIRHYKVAQETPFFTGPTQYALQNFTVYDSEQMSLAEKISQRALIPETQQPLSFAPDTAIEDWLEARTTLREELSKEQGTVQFKSQLNSFMTDLDFKAEIDNFDWAAIDTGKSIVKQHISNDTHSSHEERVGRKAHGILSLDDIPIRATRNPAVHDASLHIDTPDKAQTDNNARNAAEVEGMQAGDLPAASVMPEGIGSKGNLPPPQAAQAAEETGSSRPAKTNRNVFCAVRTRHVMSSHVPKSDETLSSSSSNFANADSRAPSSSLVLSNHSAVMQGSPQGSYATNSLASADSFGPPPGLGLTAKSPTSSGYSSGPSLGSHVPGIALHLPARFPASQMASSQSAYSTLQDIKGQGEHQNSTDDRHQMHSSGAGGESPQRRVNLGSRGMHNRGGL